MMTNGKVIDKEPLFFLMRNLEDQKLMRPEHVQEHRRTMVTVFMVSL